MTLEGRKRAQDATARLTPIIVITYNYLRARRLGEDGRGLIEGLRVGVASACIGGGQGVATIVENRAAAD
jgi:acetyl-CoA acetyltransferase